MAELLIGCGNHREKLIWPQGVKEWTDLVTLDIDPNCGAQVEHNLERFPYPFEDGTFDEIHAYHVLEHTGGLGDWRFFFAQWSEFWRILRPGGVFCCVVPSPGSPWVFGDPGHTRFIPPEILIFLDQTSYERQVGHTALADYRHVYRADFEKVYENIELEGGGQFFFVMQAIKPSRINI